MQCEGVGWTNLDHDKVQCWPLGSKEMDIRVRKVRRLPDELKDYRCVKKDPIDVLCISYKIHRTCWWNGYHSCFVFGRSRFQI
jgi:hypothetical protein